MVRKIFLSAFFLFTFSLLGLTQFDQLGIHTHQHTGRNCASTSYHDYMYLADPEYRANHEANQERLENYLKANKVDGIEKRMMCDETLLIPVAVHFQNVGFDQACAEEMAVDQVRILNEDYGATNPDIGEWTNVQAAFFPNIENQASCIQFCLATKDHPAGFGLNDGDLAVTVNQTNGDSDGAWAGYINFFVRELGGGTLGYSPLGGSANGDGVVCTLNAFGSVSCGGNAISGQYNLGRTITHELGHYLNLEHPFDDMNVGNCADHDGIADTPNTGNSTGGCPNTPPTPCSNNTLWPTYMEYCNDACLFMFTAGQVEIMEAHVNANLMNSLNLAAIKCTEAACVGFEIQAASTPESCDGNDGGIGVSTTEGNPPFNYSNNGGAFYQANSAFAGLQSGDYDIMVVDSENCEAMTTVTVIEASPPIVIGNVQDAFCGFATGAFNADVDLTTAFEFSTTDPNGVLLTSNTGEFTDLLPGNYEVTATSAGCSGTTFIQVEAPNDMDISHQVSDVNCYAFDNGEIVVNVGGGEGPYEFELDGGAESNGIGRFSLLSIGSHRVTVTDSRGCNVEIDFEIERSAGAFDDDCPCTMYLPTAFTPDGDGINEVYLTRPSCPIVEYRFEVYNKWGEMIWLSEDPTEAWTGGGSYHEDYYVHPGIYSYRITYKWGDENSQQAQNNEEVGYITVIR